MNEIETGRFLAMAIVLDPKMPQPDDQGFMRRLWTRQLADVPFDAADRALQAYYKSERYAQNRETISPADVVLWWNARRRPTDQERTGTDARRELPRPSFDAQRIRDGVDRVLAALAEAKAVRNGEDPLDAADMAEGETAYRRMVLARPCPHCKAGVAKPCVRPGTDIPLTKEPYHDSRKKLATAGAA